MPVLKQANARIGCIQRRLALPQQGHTTLVIAQGLLQWQIGVLHCRHDSLKLGKGLFEVFGGRVGSFVCHDEMKPVRAFLG